MLLGSRLAVGIRALYELALLPERRSAVRTLAKNCGVTESFLRRILLDLRAKGYLGAQKGRVGGFTLIKDPGTIKIVELAKILEKQPTLVLGQMRRGLLMLDPDCPTYPFWTNVEEKFMAELKNLTLADVMAMASKSSQGKRSRTKTAKKTQQTVRRKTRRSG